MKDILLLVSYATNMDEKARLNADADYNIGWIAGITVSVKHLDDLLK